MISHQVSTSGKVVNFLFVLHNLVSELLNIFFARLSKHAGDWLLLFFNRLLLLFGVTIKSKFTRKHPAIFIFIDLKLGNLILEFPQQVDAELCWLDSYTLSHAWITL